MFSLFLFFWLLLVLLILYCSSNLLLSLVSLEILTFFILFVFSYFSFSVLASDYYTLIFFSVFVMEGVLGLCGLIILVFYSGSDYISTSSILKL